MALKLSADQFRRSFGESADEPTTKATLPETAKSVSDISANELALARATAANRSQDEKLASAIESITEKIAAISDKPKSYKIKLTKIERKDGQIVDLELLISPVQ